MLNQEQVWTGVKEEEGEEEEASWWQPRNSFQTRPLSATGQDRHYNTEKSTSLPLNAPPHDAFSTV